MPEMSWMLTLYIHFGKSQFDNAHPSQLLAQHCPLLFCILNNMGRQWNLGCGRRAEQWTRLHSFLFLMVYFLQSRFLTAFICGFLKWISFISSTALNKPKGLRDFCSFLTLDRLESLTYAIIFNETIYYYIFLFECF